MGLGTTLSSFYMILTNWNHARDSENVAKTLGCFGALMGALQAPHVHFRVPRERQDRLARTLGYKYDIMLLQHDFNHSEPCWQKCGYVVGILGCFWACTCPRCMIQNFS